MLETHRGTLADVVAMRPLEPPELGVHRARDSAFEQRPSRHPRTARQPHHSRMQLGAHRYRLQLHARPTPRSQCRY